MAQQLTFNGQQIGDHFLKVETGDYLLTPPTRRTGLFQDNAVVNADSRNRLRARQFSVAIVRADPVLLDQAVSAIQELQGRTGDIQLAGGATNMLCQDWTIDSVSQPQLRPGFGGRVCHELVITCVGSTPPVYS